MITDRIPDILLARLLAAALVAAAMLFSSPARALDPVFENAALAGDWTALAARLGPRTEKATRGDPVERFLLGHAYLALNRNNEAVCAFETLTGADVVAAWRRWAEAVAHSHPERAFAHYARGDALARDAEWPQALAAFDAGRRLKDKAVMPLIAEAHGIALALSGEKDGAVLELAAATAGHPKSADLAASLGTYWLTAGDGAFGALEAFDKALAVNQNFALAHNGRAAVLFALGKWDAAATELVEASKGTPKCLDQPRANAATLAQSMADLQQRQVADLAAKYGMSLDIFDRVRGLTQLPMPQVRAEIAKWTAPERQVGTQIADGMRAWDNVSSDFYRLLGGGVDAKAGKSSVSLTLPGAGTLADRDAARAQHYGDVANAMRGIGKDAVSPKDQGVNSDGVRRTFAENGKIALTTRYSLNYGGSTAAAVVGK